MQFFSTLFFLLGAVFLAAACGDNFDRDTLLGITPADTGSFTDESIPVDGEPVLDTSLEPDEGEPLEEESHDIASSDEADFTIVPDEGLADDTTVGPDSDEASSPQCGNGIVESGETCDGGFVSCADLMGADYTGTAPCRGDCAGWDTSSCQQVVNHPVYAVDPAKCTGCRRCLPACSVGAISIVSYKAVIDPEKCTGCGTCASWCPRGAIYKKQ